MHKIRLGIVGLGIMGRRYYAMLRTLAGVEVTALCVRHLDTIDDLPGAKFADYRKLCASGQIDAVIIATPHYSHPQVAIEALHHGIQAYSAVSAVCIGSSRIGSVLRRTINPAPGAPRGKARGAGCSSTSVRIISICCNGL